MQFFVSLFNESVGAEAKLAELSKHLLRWRDSIEVKIFTILQQVNKQIDWYCEQS